MLPWVLADEHLTGEVLEIGGGSGAMAEVVLQEHPDAHLTLTDLDPRMIAEATGRLARFVPRAQLELADVTKLPFPDDSFDVVLSFIMLHHVGDWPAALAEVRRVLKPGGHFLGYDLTSTAVSRGFHWLDRSPVSMTHAGELRAGLNEAGFPAHEVSQRFVWHVMRFEATA